MLIFFMVSLRFVFANRSFLPECFDSVGALGFLPHASSEEENKSPLELSIPRDETYKVRGTTLIRCMMQPHSDSDKSYAMITGLPSFLTAMFGNATRE